MSETSTRRLGHAIQSYAHQRDIVAQSHVLPWQFSRFPACCLTQAPLISAQRRARNGYILGHLTTGVPQPLAYLTISLRSSKQPELDAICSSSSIARSLLCIGANRWCQTKWIEFNGSSSRQRRLQPRIFPTPAAINGGKQCNWGSIERSGIAFRRGPIPVVVRRPEIASSALQRLSSARESSTLRFRHGLNRRQRSIFPRTLKYATARQFACARADEGSLWMARSKYAMVGCLADVVQ